MPTNRYQNPLTDILFEQAGEFVGVYDAEAGWFTHVNRAGYQLMGYPSAQALYDDPARTLRTQRLTPEEWQKQRALVLQHRQNAQEMELRRYTGETFWGQVELTSFPFEDRTYLLVRIIDINRLHTAERNLAQIVERFEAVFAHATIGIIVCNAQGSIVLANEQVQEQFGYPAGTLLGQRTEILVPAFAAEDHARLRAAFNAHPQVRAMARNRDLRARRRDGSEFPVEISLSYFYQEAELFAVAYIIDVTLKRAAEQELIAQRQHVEQLNTELEQKVTDRTQALKTTLLQLEKQQQELAKALVAERELGELKSRFVSMASHEFRTPLTSVLTSSVLIEKYATTEQQDKRVHHLRRLRRSVQHLTDILEEFLSVDKIAEGRVAVHPVRVELDVLLHEAVAEVQGVRKPGQRIRQHLAAGQPMWLDGSLLHKVLVNLLTNALKYSAEDQTVTLTATQQALYLTVQVQDQGIGIAPEDQAHLFERFFRARNATNIPGTGLGLYIVANYLELLGGSIAWQSELNVGTTITLTIPYADHPTD